VYELVNCIRNSNINQQRNTPGGRGCQKSADIMHKFHVRAWRCAEWYGNITHQLFSSEYTGRIS